MLFRFCLFLVLLAPSFILFPARGQDSTGGSLHILHPAIHAEQNKAELCLEFDRTLDNKDPARTITGIRLENDDAVVPITIQNTSIANNLLCITGLTHRKAYRITVKDVEGTKGEKLADKYALSFTVPDRLPSLTYAGNQTGGGLTRWNDGDPILRAINVTRARVKLYRVSEPTFMMEAWQQRLQITLAPSESIYFANDKGKLIWQGDLILREKPNNLVEQKVPLHAAIGSLPAGLYLVTASASDIISSATNRGLTPLAASWLLRSDLKIRALPDGNAYHAFSDKLDQPEIVKNVRMIVANNARQNLAEAKTGEDGIAYIEVPENKKKDASLMLGITDDGNADIIDLPAPEVNPFTLPGLQASITTDRDFYLPSTMAFINLHVPEDMSVGDSSLQILRPDQHPYTIIPVAKDKAVPLSIPVPPLSGLWGLVWKQPDGHVLARTSLHVTTVDDAPRIEVKADRTMLGHDGDIVLNLKSLTQSGTAVPYITGSVTAAWSTPQNIFPGWEGYSFGKSEPESTETSAPLASFITNHNGDAQFSLNLKPPSDSTGLHQVTLMISSDPGIKDPPPLIIPVRPKDFIIGLKAAVPGGQFAENSLARFDVIALDADGHRRSVDDLSWQLYEEGRGFEWYQAEGRWDYKPLAQRRRISGGTLNLKSDKNASIETRVTAGNYQLEVTDTAGNVYARQNFNAGWGNRPTESSEPIKLDLTAPARAQVGQTVTIRFKLEQASVISAFIANGHLRKIIHEAKPQGDAEITFTPETNWGPRLGVWIEANSAKNGQIAKGQLTLPLAATGEVSVVAPPPVPVEPPHEPASLLPFEITANPPSLVKVGDSLPLEFELRNNSGPTGTYRYTISAPDMKIDINPKGSFTLKSRQQRSLVFTLEAPQAGLKELRIDVTGPRGFRGSYSWPISVIANDQILNTLSSEIIEGQQSWTRPAKKTNAGGEFLVLASEPILGLPHILAKAANANPFTTSDVADQLYILHLWHDALTQLNILAEAEYQQHRQALVLRLLQRQKSDGSFPVLAKGDGDIVSTSKALMALETVDQTHSKPILNQAAAWLKHRLDNSWFDEKERPERANAYMALAATGYLDIANLHYFGDTSLEKNLPPLAAAQVAFAFAANNDRDKAMLWLGKTGFEKENADVDPLLLPVLAANNFFPVQDLVPALTKLSAALIKPEAHNFVAVSRFLRTAWWLHQRAGSWPVAINNDEQSNKGILIKALSEKAASLTIRNLADKKLYLSEVAADKNLHGGEPIIRHIYKPNNNEVLNLLEAGEMYVVVLEGPWTPNADKIVLHDETGRALTPVSCALPQVLESNDELHWLNGLNLSAVKACEKLGQAITALLERTDPSAKEWRIAYFAKAGTRKGVFNLPSVRAHNFENYAPVAKGTHNQIRLR